jgi:DNA-binding SARP family transcriptional activator/energy-coupling factor transporter ATP-binding protein EcfA2
MASLRLDLLGGFSLRLPSGAAIRLPTRKGRSLLAYLALTPNRAEPRATLLGLLWSDRAEAQARGSLRQELHALRQALAGMDPPALRVAGDLVALDAGAVKVDALVFERLAKSGGRDALKCAAALYRGDLLAGLTVRDPVFDEWLSFERRRLRDLATGALGKLLALQLDDAAPEEALTTARRLLALDRTHEVAHRSLMRLLARCGERNAALRQYQLCRTVLASELGVEPEAETEALHRELLRPALDEAAAEHLARTTQSNSAESGLAEAAAQAPATEGWAPRVGAAPERRQLAVAFVDLVDSTALATGLDPEDMREVLEAYQRAVAEAVALFGGRVFHHQGDGILACFGWPHAHEDDAERAVRAGLAAAEAVSRLRLERVGPLACRVGVAAGLVVVSGPADAPEIVGEPPHLASRLHAMGPPGAVVLAEPMRRQLGELFAFESLGARLPKGFATPVKVWRVAGEDAARGRFEALRGAAGLTPLLGRRRELGLLLDRWRLAREGEGQVVLVCGESGIGKSRLVQALRARLVDERHTPLALYCSPHHANTALYPTLRLLERAAGLRRYDPPERQLDALEAMLALAGERAPDHDAPLLAELLGIPDTGRYPRQDELTPQARKERTLGALLDQLDGLAARGPVLVLYDDAHWADPTTLELLDRVVERVRGRPVMVVVTFRPGFDPAWAEQGHVTTLALGRLDHGPAAALVAEQAGGDALPRELVERILDRADGVPLYLEELTRAVLVAAPADNGGAPSRCRPHSRARSWPGSTGCPTRRRWPSSGP